jgi:5-methylcytosine-specific restriction enzyme A
MATSRTGTGQWKRVVLIVKAQARRDGLTLCPGCKQTLDWGKRIPGQYNPRLVEVDHIVTHEDGGLDTVDNARILCSDCNKKRRSRERATAAANHSWPKPRTSRAW